MDILRSASAVWHGDNVAGSERVSTESGALKDVEMTFPKRFGDDKGSNPEELLAAAHASCYNMALTAGLTRAGTPPDEISTTARVTLHKGEAGFSITQVHLTTVARVPGLDAEAFLKAAQGAKDGCPVSRLLAPGLESLTLDAQLAN